MATFKSKQLNPNLTGSFAVSGSFGVTGPLTATTFVGMISGSAQIASDISGSFTSTSASFSTSTTSATASIAALVADSGSFSTRITTDSGSISTRLTTEEANVDALQVDSGSFSVRVTNTETTASSLINDFSKVQSLGTTDSVIFDAINTTGDVTVRGNIIAETYIVSSSITRLTSSFSSGSTIFGDTIDDTHQFTGSAFISGSLTAVNLVADSGSFSTRTTTLEAASASFSTRVTTEESNVDVLQARNINTGLGLSGGGNLTADRTLAIDFSDSDFQTGISGSFTSPSASFSTRLTTAEDELNNTLISGSAQIATDISGSLGDNADLIRTLTAAGISGSSGFAAALSPAAISGSWQGALSGSLNVISGSAISTGSFGRIEVDVVEAQRFVVSSSVTNITTIDVSGSTNFGDSSDDRHSFTGSLIIPSGSLEGEVYIDTNDSKMFIGKYSGGIEVSGSANASRYVTAGDGSLIDLGFTSVDDSGVTVLTAIGDGIHSDSNNYWYNNNFFKVGSNNKYVQYDPGLNILKARGELVATTGSYFGEMHINNQQGSMFVGKNSKGIPVSGSLNMSRYVTGSDGSIVDIGFITVDEDGNETFLTTGDGLVRDANNYWYNTGHFKLGDANQYIQWDNTNLTISGSSSSTASFGFYANISASVAAAGFGSGGGGGSSFTAAGISGSFTSVSASLSARLTSEEAEAEGSVVSSSAQLATDISGSFTSVSSSLAARITVEEAEGGGGGSFTAAGISGSFQGGGSNLISGSATSTGSFGRLEVSDTATIGGKFSLPNISDVSASLAAAVAGGDNLGNHTATQDINLDSNSIKNILHVTASGNISGSSTSTGSFGELHIADKIGIGTTNPDNSSLHVAGHINLDDDKAVAWGGGSSRPAIIGNTSNNTLKFYTNGSERISVASSGEIGIGVSSPENYYNSPLVTYQASANYLTIATNTNGISSILMADGTSGAQAYVAQLEYQHATDEWRFHGGGSRFMTILNGHVTGSGNVLYEGGLLRLGKASNADGKIILHNNTGTATFTIQNEDGNGIFQASSDSNRILTFNNAGAGNLGIEVEGNISGSATSTGSFGALNIDGGHFTSASLAAGGSGGSDDTSWNDGTATRISGSATSTGSFGRGVILDRLFIGEDPISPGVTQKLSISSDDHTVLNIQSVGSGKEPSIQFMRSNGEKYYIQHESNGLNHKYYAGSGGTYPSYMFVDNSQNIGMGGQTSPSHKLDVTGTGRFTDTLTTAAINASGNISGSATSTGSFGRVESPLSGKIIGNLTELIEVTVVSDGGNHYAFEGATAPSLQVSEGKTYRFDISDSTVGSHPFRFSTVQDGGHNGGSAYTTGVLVVGTQGQAGAYVELQVTKATANHLYYYCTSHPGMGNDGKIMKNDLTNLHMVSGSAQSTGSLGSLKIAGASVDFSGLPTSDPSVAGRLWNDSNTLKISAG